MLFSAHHQQLALQLPSPNDSFKKLKKLTLGNRKLAKTGVFRPLLIEFGPFDSRPAINAALPGSYVIWSQSIYLMELSHATDQPS